MKRVLALVVVAAGLVVAAVIVLPVERPEEPTVVASGVEVVRDDPFAFRRAGSGLLTQRAADGLAHVLYEYSPGGVMASARRTARFAEEIRAAAERERVNPETLEALVLLESAGRPGVIAGPNPESASGLAQILPSTATDLLGMSVGLRRSKAITAEIPRQERRAARAAAAAERLRARANRARRELEGSTPNDVPGRSGRRTRSNSEGERGRGPRSDRRPGRERDEGKQGRKDAPESPRDRRPGARPGDRARDGRGEGAPGDEARRRPREARGSSGPSRDGPADRPTRRARGRPEALAARAARAERRARHARRRVEQLRERRREVDERFDPRAALAGAARYLALAEERFGREDLAIASYHMGIGNLEAVIGTYLGRAARSGGTRGIVREHDLSYSRLYFDSSPLRNRRTYAALRRLGDDSRHYLFKLEAARDIMALWREDRAKLRRLVELHGNKASAEEVLRPPGRTERFEDPAELRRAYRDGDLVRLEEEPGRLGYRVDRQMGELARQLGERPPLYRGLRPEALATVVHLADDVREIAGRRARITLTSSVRDEPYQELLGATNVQATDGYSLHTTGYAFDISGDLPKRTVRALVFGLERLRALNVVDWVEEPGAYHVTVGPGARRFLAGNGRP